MNRKMSILLYNHSKQKNVCLYLYHGETYKGRITDWRCEHMKLRRNSGGGKYLKSSLSLTNIYLLLATPPQSSLKILGCERMGKEENHESCHAEISQINHICETHDSLLVLKCLQICQTTSGTKLPLHILLLPEILGSPFRVSSKCILYSE